VNGTGPLAGLYQLTNSEEPRCKDGCAYINPSGDPYCFETLGNDKYETRPCESPNGGSTQDKLTFNETGQTYVQEQISIEETGILASFLVLLTYESRLKLRGIAWNLRLSSIHR